MMKYLIYFFMLLIIGGSGYLAYKDWQKEQIQNGVERALEQDSTDGYVLSQTNENGETEIVIDPFPGGSGVSLLVNIATWIWNNYQNFAAILMSLLLALVPIVRWTPTERDNDLLRTIQSWLDRFLPNNKVGGGTFTAFSKKDDAPPQAYVKPESYDDTSGGAARRAKT